MASRVPWPLELDEPKEPLVSLLLLSAPRREAELLHTWKGFLPTPPELPYSSPHRARRLPEILLPCSHDHLF